MVFYRPGNLDDEDHEGHSISFGSPKEMDISSMQWEPTDEPQNNRIGFSYHVSPLNQPMNHMWYQPEGQNIKNFFTGKNPHRHSLYNSLSPKISDQHDHTRHSFMDGILKHSYMHDYTKHDNDTRLGHSSCGTYKLRPRVQLLPIQDPSFSSLPMDVDPDEHSYSPNASSLTEHHESLSSERAFSPMKLDDDNKEVIESFNDGATAGCYSTNKSLKQALPPHLESKGNTEGSNDSASKRRRKVSRPASSGWFSKLWKTVSVLLSVLMALAFYENSSKYTSYIESFNDNLDHENCFDLESITRSLKSDVIGQDVAVDSIFRELQTFLDPSNNERVLVLSIHGSSGTGKLHISQLIASQIPRDSFKFFYVFKQFHDSTIEGDVDNFRNDMKTLSGPSLWKTSECPYLVVLNTMEYASEALVNEFVKTIQKFNDKYSRKIVFLILSSTGSDIINSIVKDNLSRDLPRETLNEDAFLKNADFVKELQASWVGNLLERNIIKIIPLLPFERKHLMLCAKEFTKKSKVMVSEELITKVVDDILYNPQNKDNFSASGCKRIPSKMDGIIFKNICKINSGVISLDPSLMGKVCSKS